MTRIGEAGSPRCCKRDSFVTLQLASELFGLERCENDEIICEFSKRNRQCIYKQCVYHQKKNTVKKIEKQ